MATDAERVRSLWKRIQEEENESEMENLINQMSEADLELMAEETKEIRSPYSFYNVSDKEWVCFSRTNIQEQYLRKETTTSLIAFLYRMLFEEQDITESEKNTINTFLGKYLEFNPDIHIRSAYDKKHPKDLSREDLSSLDREFVKAIPPIDSFHRWRLFHEANYDSIRKATEIIYADKPDIEDAIIIYEKFKSSEDAAEFVKKYQKDFKTDVFTVMKGKWAFTFPFKANRQKTEIYSKNHEILEELLKKREEDQKLGEDMLKNRVRKNKKKLGQVPKEETKELEEFKRLFDGFSKKGVRNLTDDEKNKMNYAKDRIELEATEMELSELMVKLDSLTPEETFRYKELKEKLQIIKDSLEVPDNAIQVNVYEADVDGSFNQSKFYTKAETPEETEARLRREEIEQKHKLE